MVLKVVAEVEEEEALHRFYFLLTVPLAVEEAEAAVVEVAAAAEVAPFLEQVLIYDDLLEEEKKVYEMFSQSAGMNLHRLHVHLGPSLGCPPPPTCSLGYVASSSPI